MEELGFPDRHFVLAAEGWLELGNAAEAAQELTRVRRVARRHPDVLELNWRVLAQLGEWDLALGVAGAVVQVAPDRPSGWIHRSYTLHELKRTPEAWEALLPAAEQFPEEAIIAYNLACYACQLGDLDGAETWLSRAARLRGREEIKSMGLQDPDLRPLAGFLQQL